MTTEQIDSAELSTLREKARMYDEAAGQLPHGYFDTVHGQYYDDAFDQAAEDPNNECVPLYAKPVPQAMADAALQAVKDWDIAHYMAYGEFVVPEPLRKLIQKAVGK